METVAIILALLGTSGMLAYLASQFKSEGSKYASIMKILFNSSSFLVLLTVPFAALSIASSNSLQGLKQISQVAVVPTVFLFVVFVFYLIWQYLEDLVGAVSGSKSDIRQDEFR